MNEKPCVAILILNNNGIKWLTPLYDSIRKQEYKNIKIYLVDNASTDESVEMTRKQYPYITVLRFSKNMGFSMAYNLAIPYVFADGCDWVILANNDILLEPGCLQELVSAAMQDEHIGVLGPAFLEWETDIPNYYMKGKHPDAIKAMEARSSTPINVDWVEGSFFMINRKCMEMIGPLDPYLFFYWEDADFCRRAEYQGWKVALVPSALVRHYARGWSRNNENKKKRNLLLTRNQYIYKLTNPKLSFMQNLLYAFYLLCVNVKACFRRIQKRSILFEIQVIVIVLKSIKRIYKKWSHDKMKKKFPKTVKEYENIKVEIIR